MSRGPESSVSDRSLAFPELGSVVPVRLVLSARNEVDDEVIMPALWFMMPRHIMMTDLPRLHEHEPPLSPALDERRITPTRIRQCEPPPLFAVTSCPQHRTQQSGGSGLEKAVGLRSYSGRE